MKETFTHRMGLLVLAVMFLVANSRGAAEIVAGHVDDFEQGTTLGWQHRQENPHEPRVVEFGGPEGAEDAFVRLSSSGGLGPGSKLAMFNEQDAWVGSFLGAGITALEADVNNLGAEPVTMRFHFEGDSGTVTTRGFELPATSGWQHASFSLNPEDLTADGDVLRVLDDVSRVWLVHESHPPPPDARIVGVDNITAVGMTVAPPLLGDFNGNGRVEQADLDLVLLHWGSPAEPRPGAWTTDLPLGTIDQDELDRVLLHWGSQSEQQEAVAIPEPAAWSVLLVAAAAAIAPAWGVTGSRGT